MHTRQVSKERVDKTLVNYHMKKHRFCAVHKIWHVYRETDPTMTVVKFCLTGSHLHISMGSCFNNVAAYHVLETRQRM